MQPVGEPESGFDRVTSLGVLIAGLALAAWLLGAPPLWIMVGVVVMLGVGIISATSRTKPRDPPMP